MWKHDWCHYGYLYMHAKGGFLPHGGIVYMSIPLLNGSKCMSQAPTTF